MVDLERKATKGNVCESKNGASGRNRTGTTRGRGILNPLCLPISPPRHFLILIASGIYQNILEARPGVEPGYVDLQSSA